MRRDNGYIFLMFLLVSYALAQPPRPNPPPRPDPSNTPSPTNPPGTPIVVGVAVGGLAVLAVLIYCGCRACGASHEEAERHVRPVIRAAEIVNNPIGVAAREVQDRALGTNRAV